MNAKVVKHFPGSSGCFSKIQRGDSGYQKDRMMNIIPIGIWMMFDTLQAMLYGDEWNDIP
jgi:hypothetical protein